MPNPSGNKINEISSDTSLPKTENSSASIGKGDCITDSALKVSTVVKTECLLICYPYLLEKICLVNSKKSLFILLTIKYN